MGARISIRVGRDEELLARLGSGRSDLADLGLDMVTRRVTALLWALRSEVDSEPLPLLVTGKAEQA